MADDKKNAEKEGGGKKKMLIIIIIVLLLAIAGGVAGFFMLKSKNQDEEPQDPGEKVPVPEISQSSEIGPMIEVTEFVVNIISEDNNHYVKAAMSLELSSEELKEEADHRMPQIRDAILLLIGNKTYEELHDLQGKKQLKAEIMSKVNSFLQTGKVRAVYFTDFVVQ